jgi:hypothetical protein
MEFYDVSKIGLGSKIRTPYAEILAFFEIKYAETTIFEIIKK